MCNHKVMISDAGIVVNNDMVTCQIEQYDKLTKKKSRETFVSSVVKKFHHIVIHIPFQRLC